MMHRGAALAAVLFALPVFAQEAPPNAPHYVKSLQAPGLDVRYLDFRWDADAFSTLMKGGANPGARRSWALARLLVTRDPFKCQGKFIPVGPSLLILNPAQGSAGATLELRSVDMREIFVNMNVIAEPPPGDTYVKVPAVFRKVDTTANRLELALTESSGGLDLTVHYGDREIRITLAPG